jgi:hypothetical protein
VGESGQLGAAAHAAINAAISLALWRRYKPGRVGRDGIAGEGTAHLLFVCTITARPGAHLRPVVKV